VENNRYSKVNKNNKKKELFMKRKNSKQEFLNGIISYQRTRMKNKIQKNKIHKMTSFKRKRKKKRMNDGCDEIYVFFSIIFAKMRQIDSF
jgi:hypothetical protein